MNILPKEIYSDALRGARNKLKAAKSEYRQHSTIEKERKIREIRRRCSVYGQMAKGCK